MGETYQSLPLKSKIKSQKRKTILYEKVPRLQSSEYIGTTEIHQTEMARTHYRGSEKELNDDNSLSWVT